MSVTFDEPARSLLDAPNFAVIATLDPDGAPRTSTAWILRDGDTVLFSTTTSRRKARNLARDGRVSISVFDLTNPYRSICAASPKYLPIRTRRSRRRFHASTSARIRLPSRRACSA